MCAHFPICAACPSHLSLLDCLCIINDRKLCSREKVFTPCIIDPVRCGEKRELSQKIYGSVITAQTAYLRSVKGCTRLDCFQNEYIRHELKVITMTENIDSYSKRWGEYLLSIPKIAFEYNSNGRRAAGRARNKWAV